MLDMQNNLKLNQTINQSISQWENKKESKSQFSHQPVSGSVKTQQEKINGHQMRDLTDRA